MQERHKDRAIYFKEQAYTTEKYVIPFIQRHKQIAPGCSVLEIGCGEGGNLKPFLDMGCICTGVDLNGPQIEKARQFFSSHPKASNIMFLYSDIYDINPEEYKADIVVLRDVIEHIHNQEQFLKILPKFLKPHGVVFFAFPPWYMPFGGHQQVCEGFLSKVPYFHLLPRKWYGGILKACGEKEPRIESLQEVKETGITLERFERILSGENYQILEKEYYLINPNYEIKFHIRPRKVLPVFRAVPYLRDFYTTAGYYLVTK